MQTLTDQAITAANQLNQSSDDDDSSRIELAKTHSRIGSIFARLGNRTVANQHHRQAIQHWETVETKLTGMMQCEMVRSYLLAINGLVASQLSEEAREMMTHAIRLAETIVQDRDTATPDFLSLMSRAYRNQAFSRINKLDECLPVLLKGFEVTDYLQERHPLVPKYAGNYLDLRYHYGLLDGIAGIHVNKGRYEEAIPVLLDLVEKQTAMLEQDPDNGGTVDSTHRNARQPASQRVALPTNSQERIRAVPAGTSGMA